MYHRPVASCSTQQWLCGDTYGPDTCTYGSDTHELAFITYVAAFSSTPPTEMLIAALRTLTRAPFHVHACT